MRLLAAAVINPKQYMGYWMYVYFLAEKNYQRIYPAEVITFISRRCCSDKLRECL